MTAIYDDLDATAGGTTSNSYATVAEADDYHDSIVSTWTSDWTGAATELKEDALMWATRLIDQYSAWEGDKADEDQRLRWPRSDVYDPDGIEIDDTTIPQFLKEATAEFARALITKELTKEPIRGYKRVKIDKIEIEFDAANVKRVLINSVRAFIAPCYGRISIGSFSRPVTRV